MKRILFCAMLSLILSAYSEEFTAGNKSVELKVNDGVIQLFAKGSDKAAATLRPAFKGAVTPKVVERPANGYSILELRNSDTILTFKFHPTLPCVYMALNKNASPVTVEWNAEAVVVPSLLGENAIIPKGSQEHYLPPFAPMYSALLDNGDAILSVIPVKARQDAILSPDLKTITLHQRNIEDYYFVLTCAKGCWSKCVATAEAGLEQTYDDCPKPYSAEWKASIPLEKDFFPSGDGNYSTWFVPTIIESNGKNSMDNPPPRVSLPPDKLPTRSAWSSGMEGSYRYPVEFLDGKFKFFYPRFRSLERYKISTARPIYIYALNGSNVPDVTFPWPFLPAWVSANGQYSTMNFGSSPATCASTASMEKIFYQDQAKEKAKEIKRILDSMQFFVESIRSRAEDALVWKGLMLEYAEHELKASPELADAVATLRSLLEDFDNVYQTALPTIKYPPEVQKLSAEVVAIAESDEDSEVKENKAKELGRAIRTIGGGQDNLIANMRRISKNICYKAITLYSQEKNPAVRAFWGEVYRKTEERLQGNYGHEGR